MTKRLNESGVLLESESGSGARKAILISQGLGSSGYYGPEFFSQENADALAGALSFPGHPEMWSDGSSRDPLSAIAWIGESVTIEEDEVGAKRFVSTYNVAESKPDVSAYLKEFGKKLGLSIFIEGEGEYDSTTNVFTIKTLNGADPYRSVDLVVAAGRGGALLEGAKPGTKNAFAEAQRKLLALGESQTSAPAEEEKEENEMTVEEKVAENTAAIKALTDKFDALIAAEKATVESAAQVEADEAAVTAAVESRFDQFTADSTLINEAGLTESQKAEAFILAKSGGDVTSFVEKAKKVLEEARALAGTANTAGGGRVAEHVAGSTSGERAIGSAVPGFGKVR